MSSPSGRDEILILATANGTRARRVPSLIRGDITPISSAHNYIWTNELRNLNFSPFARAALAIAKDCGKRLHGLCDPEGVRNRGFVRIVLACPQENDQHPDKEQMGNGVGAVDLGPLGKVLVEHGARGRH